MTSGYIVQCSSGGAMVAVWNTEAAELLLYFGKTATVFQDRREAKRSITKTIVSTPTFETEFGRLSVKRLEPALGGR